MHTKGFTLIELMVSVAIFSIVMVMALGALLSMSASDRKAETIASVLNNLDAAMETMTRNIRSGYDYHCATATGGDCASGSNYFKFTAADGTATIYSFSNSACNQTSATKGCILRSTDGGTTFLPLTAPEVIITNLTFYLRGSAGWGTGDRAQPNVIMTVAGYIQVSPTQTSSFSLQTSVTQRLYDH